MNYKHDCQALQGNKELCGNVSGLTPCNVCISRKHILGKRLVISFAVARAFTLLIVVTVMFFCFWRKKQKQLEERRSVNKYKFLLVLNFDEKTMFEEIKV